MPLELLANELLLDIFEYLSDVDLFHAFSQLNVRFDCLLTDYFRNHKHIDFRLMFKADLNMFRRRYLSSFINEIKSICLSDDDTNPHEIDCFISRLFPLHYFGNLQSISLFNIYSTDKISRLLGDLQHISNLNHLIFKQCHVPYEPKSILNMMNSIWSLPNITHCCLDIYFDNDCHLIPPTIISCSLRHLSISGVQCDMNNLAILYEHTPYLEDLSISIWDPYNDHYQLSLLPSLTTLKLKCESSSRIIQALLRRIPNLVNLTVETNIIHMDGHMWKDVIHKYLSSLKVFNLSMTFELIENNTNGNDIEQEVDQLLDSYKTEFWTEQHKWFVQCLSYAENENTIIHVHTIPYVFNNLSIDINEHFLVKSTLPQDIHESTYNHVHYLEYCCTTSEDILLPRMQFPNIQHLTLTLPYDDYLQTLIPNLINLKSLELKVVVFNNFDDGLSQLQFLLDRAPRLYYLKFHSWSSGLSKNDNRSKKVSNSGVWRMPPFSNRSSSVRYLDLRGTNHSGQNHYYNDLQCSFLIRSPLGNQCEFLRIDVENRTSIIDLVNKMPHLRTLNVRCHDRKKQDDELIKWLHVRLPSTCSFAKDSKFSNDIRIWIR